MNAQQIRELTHELRTDASRAARGEVSPHAAFYPGPHTVESMYGITTLLGEIAAQLAEANRLKRIEMRIYSVEDVPVANSNPVDPETDYPF